MVNKYNTIQYPVQDSSSLRRDTSEVKLSPLDDDTEEFLPS